MNGARNRTSLQSQDSVIAVCRGKKVIGYRGEGGKRPHVTQDQIDAARKLSRIHSLSIGILIGRLRPRITTEQAALLLKAVR